MAAAVFTVLWFASVFFASFDFWFLAITIAIFVWRIWFETNNKCSPLCSSLITCVAIWLFLADCVFRLIWADEEVLPSPALTSLVLVLQVFLTNGTHFSIALSKLFLSAMLKATMNASDFSEQYLRIISSFSNELTSHISILTTVGGTKFKSTLKARFSSINWISNELHTANVDLWLVVVEYSRSVFL